MPASVENVPHLGRRPFAAACEAFGPHWGDDRQDVGGEGVGDGLGSGVGLGAGLLELGIAELDAARLGRRPRFLGPLGNLAPLFLRERRPDVPHEGGHVVAQLGDDERNVPAPGEEGILGFLLRARPGT